MIVTKTWERYFLKEIIKTFIFFAIAICAIFCVIDYPTQPFHKYDIPFKIMSIYYLCQFSYRAEILVPLCLMLSSIKVMCSSNVHREFIALLAGGVRKYYLITPFLIVGLLCTIFNYVNFEYAYPKSMSWTAHFKEAYLFRAVYPKKDDGTIYNILLNDGSNLVYKTYNPVNKTAKDVYWIKSIDDICKIKYLLFDKKVPVGYYVSHFKRTNGGELYLTSSSKKEKLKNITFDSEDINKILVPPKERPLSDLLEDSFKQKEIMTDKKAELLTTLYKKLMMPLLCLLVIIAPAPFCMSFHRKLPIFRIFCFSLLGFIVFIMTINAANILGISKIIHPAVAIFTPMSIFFSVSLLLATKLKK